jgi:hypothetical protein
VRVWNGKVSVTDGPFVETNEQIIGLFFISASDLNEAIHVASQMPQARGGPIEVRPMMVFDQPYPQGEIMKKTDSTDGLTPSQLITNQIAELADWRGKLLARLRKLILEADPDITEEWKWGTAVWSHKGNVVAIGAFKDHVKLNFFKGASLKDPKGLFNAGLDAKATRAIDLREGNKINESALKDLIRAAVALNTASGKKK